MEAYLTGQYSQQKICETFKIRSRTRLRAWLKVYNSGRDFKRMSGGSPNACSVIGVLLRQWKSTGWHLPRKKSAKSRTPLAAKILFYLIVLLTGCGSEVGRLLFHAIAARQCKCLDEPHPYNV